MLHWVTNIVSVEPYKITLQFNTGEVKSVDIETKLNEWSRSPDSKFRQLLQPDYFKSAKLNNELCTVYWDNGIDFCPDVLYSLSR
jgi:hypothetical protein